MKFTYIAIVITSSALLSGCLVPPKRVSLDNATVYNWQHDYVTFQQFSRDHMNCFGIKEAPMQSQFMKTLDPLSPRVMPKWDGVWATFENRTYRETSQRIAVQLPPGTTGWPVSRYKKCMYQKGYYLIY